MRFRSKRNVFLFSIIAGFSMAASANDELPETTVDGLQRVNDTRLSVVYAEPGADLSTYENVLLLDAYVAFKKNWKKNQRSKSVTSNRIRNSDIERIKKNLAAEFDRIFTQTLNDGGYPVVDHAGENVLMIRPAIINLDITAPDVTSASHTRQWTASAGEMTLYVELFDSVTGDLIAKAMDRKADRAHSGFYTWSDSSKNKAAATRILTGWAEILLSALNEAKTQNESQSWVTPSVD